LSNASTGAEPIQTKYRGDHKQGDEGTHERRVITNDTGSDGANRECSSVGVGDALEEHREGEGEGGAEAGKVGAATRGGLRHEVASRRVSFRLQLATISLGANAVLSAGAALRVATTAGLSSATKGTAVSLASGESDNPTAPVTTPGPRGHGRDGNSGGTKLGAQAAIRAVHVIILVVIRSWGRRAERGDAAKFRNPESSNKSSTSIEIPCWQSYIDLAGQDRRSGDHHGVVEEMHHHRDQIEHPNREDGDHGTGQKGPRYGLGDAKEATGGSREGPRGEDEVVPQEGACHASSTRKKGAKLDVYLESIGRHHAREQGQQEEWRVTSTTTESEATSRRC
jgi:hypothetical protein